MSELNDWYRAHDDLAMANALAMATWKHKPDPAGDRANARDPFLPIVVTGNNNVDTQTVPVPLLLSGDSALANVAAVGIIRTEDRPQVLIGHQQTSSLRTQHSDSVLAGFAPALRCPRCNLYTWGLGEARQPYATGADLPLEAHLHFEYSLRPCGCWLDGEWCGALTKEMNARRLANGASSACRDRCVRRYNELVDRLQTSLRHLATAEAHSLSYVGGQYAFVIASDRLYRLAGVASFNRHTRDIHVDLSAVRGWIVANNYMIPVGAAGPGDAISAAEPGWAAGDAGGVDYADRYPLPPIYARAPVQAVPADLLPGAARTVPDMTYQLRRRRRLIHKLPE